MAEKVLALVFTYKDALLATFHFKRFEIVFVGGLGRGRNWIVVLSNLLIDLIGVIGLWPIIAIEAHPVVNAAFTLCWVLLTDGIGRRGWLENYVVDPLVRRLDPWHYDKWTSSIVVMGKLVRDEVIRHVRINLEAFGGHLAAGLDIARHPNLSVPDLQRKEITNALERALRETKAVRKNTSGFVPAQPPVWKKLIDKIPWEKIFLALPTAGFLLPALSLWGGIGLCLAWVLAYHLLAWMSVPMYESAVRKETLFEGSFTTTSDANKLIYTGVSRLEQEVYRHLNVSPPSVKPWVFSGWPFVHYLLVIVMIVSSFLIWREKVAATPSEHAVVFVFGANIVFHQLRLLVVHFRRWMRA